MSGVGCDVCGAGGGGLLGVGVEGWWWWGWCEEELIVGRLRGVEQRR